MDCRRAKRMISAYIDGELSLAKRLLLSEHLMACERCRRRMMELKEVSKAVSSLPLEPAPLRIWHGISSAMGRRKKRLRIKVAAFAALAILISFLSLFFWYPKGLKVFGGKKGEDISISSVLAGHSRIRGDELLGHVIGMAEFEEE